MVVVVMKWTERLIENENEMKVESSKSIFRVYYYKFLWQKSYI